VTHALQLVGIHKSFDGFAALTDASFSASWGEVHALLGENGAGKSSLMNIAAGLYAAEKGTILVDDQPILFNGPRDAAKQRIGMVHQHFRLVLPFTVAQNVLINAAPDDARTHRERLKRVQAAIVSKAAQLGFEINPNRRIDELSIAEQQRVEILKVLLAGAKIVILDEPTAVLADQEAENLLVTVKNLARSGASVILVTHKMADVKRHTDRVTVMRGGRTITTVEPQQCSIADLVKLTVGDASLGDLNKSAENPSPPTFPSTSIPSALTVRSLAGSGQHVQLKGVSFDLKAGEIYGLAGVGGNGQSELAAALMGLNEVADLTGDIVLDANKDLKALTTPNRRNLGIATIPADRYGLALAGGLSIAENYAVAQVNSGRYGSIWRLKKSQIEQDAKDAITEFDVQGVRSIHQKAALLSGGNAQKLVLAREFGKKPKLVLAHSPSRGLDVRATAQVQARLVAAKDDGAAVLLISEDLDEVLSLADRIGVMADGQIVAEFQQPFDRQAIGQAMVAHG
jgi:general nucleoside transport system ATP-binding protein